MLFHPANSQWTQVRKMYALVYQMTQSSHESLHLQLSPSTDNSFRCDINLFKQVRLICMLFDKRVWFRIRDPNSSKRKLSASSQRIINMYFTWLSHLFPVRTMWPKQQWTGLCVADVYASGKQSGIGGAIIFPWTMLLV